MNPPTPILALDGITKTFPGVTALSAVSLRLYPGQVTALVGENGAGKSTVVKILTGIYQPTEGRILVDGTETRFPTAQDAADAGITAIHQETVLFDELSVAENIFLGHAPRDRFGLIDWAAMARMSREILDGIGAEIDPGAKLRDLGIANKHLVAIARALSIDARVVIMDEPTAALSHKEIQELYDLVEQLKDAGQGDPVHQPQVRRDLPDRRQLHRVSRRPVRWRGPDCRRDQRCAGQDDGRARGRQHLPRAPAGSR